MLLLLPQVANQPGLEEVFADLLEYEQREQDSSSKEDTGAEFYCLACPAHLEGERAAKLCRNCVRLSVMSSLVLVCFQGVCAQHFVCLSMLSLTICTAHHSQIFAVCCWHCRQVLPNCAALLPACHSHWLGVGC